MLLKNLKEILSTVQFFKYSFCKKRLYHVRDLIKQTNASKILKRKLLRIYYYLHVKKKIKICKIFQIRCIIRRLNVVNLIKGLRNRIGSLIFF